MKLCQNMNVFYTVAALFLVTTDANCGAWRNIKAKSRSDCPNGNECLVVGSGLVLECDDDEGDAAAKTILYRNLGSSIDAHKCTISGDLFGDDKWESRTLQKCANNTCPAGRQKVAFSNNSKKFICAPVNRGIKTVGGYGIITEGGTSEAVGCLVDETQATPTPAPAPAPTTKCPNGKQYGETWTAACSGSSWESVKLHGKDCGARCNSGGNYSIYAITCKDGYTPSDKWDAIAGGGYQACVKTSNGGGGNSGGGTTPVSCRDSRTTATGKACCDTGRMATYNAATDTCTCSARGLTFKIENGIGKCVPIDITPTTYDCVKDNPTEMSNVRAWKVKCVSNTEIMTQIRSLEEFCQATGRTKDAFMDYYNALVAMNPDQCGAVAPGPSEEEQLCAQISDAQMVGGVCKCKDATKELNRELKKCVASQASMSASKTTIETTFKKLDGINSTFGTSVWKNKEGNFNTARLASDSIAGVVLGTAGGLITSNVVKKNQIKGGFEDINCTIGGQVVSGWGDEFNVGINTSGL